jgi:hypothetical protein
MVEKYSASESDLDFKLLRHLYVIQLILMPELTTHDYDPF